jgi:hypothetical protein
MWRLGDWRMVLQADEPVEVPRIEVYDQRSIAVEENNDLPGVEEVVEVVAADRPPGRPLAISRGRSGRGS